MQKLGFNKEHCEPRLLSSARHPWQEQTEFDTFYTVISKKQLRKKMQLHSHPCQQRLVCIQDFTFCQAWRRCLTLFQEAGRFTPSTDKMFFTMCTMTLMETTEDPRPPAYQGSSPLPASDGDCCQCVLGSQTRVLCLQLIEHVHSQRPTIFSYDYF